jgi:hypothetical protein
MERKLLSPQRQLVTNAPRTREGNMRKKYGWIQALVLSFYSRALYRDVATRWRGACLLYLWNVLAIGWTAMIVIGSTQTSDVDYFIDQIPRVRFAQGVASVEGTDPWVINSPNGAPLVLFDTSSDNEVIAPEIPYVVTRHTLTFNSETETRVIRFNDQLDLTLDKDIVRGLLGVLGWVIVAGCFVYRFFQLLIYGAIAKRFAARAGTKLSYPSASRRLR